MEAHDLHYSSPYTQKTRRITLPQGQSRMFLWVKCPSCSVTQGLGWDRRERCRCASFVTRRHIVHSVFLAFDENRPKLKEILIINNNAPTEFIDHLNTYASSPM